MNRGHRAHTHSLSRLDFKEVKGHRCPPAPGRQRSKGDGRVNAQMEGRLEGRERKGGCEPEGGATERRPGLSLGRVAGPRKREATLYRNVQQLSHLIVAPFKGVCGEPGYSGGVSELRA